MRCIPAIKVLNIITSAREAITFCASDDSLRNSYLIGANTFTVFFGLSQILPQYGAGLALTIVLHLRPWAGLSRPAGTGQQTGPVSTQPPELA